MALIDYNTTLYRVSTQRLKSTSNCFFSSGIGDESLTLHSQGGNEKLVDLPCAKTLRNFLASVAKDSTGKSTTKRPKPAGINSSSTKKNDILEPEHSQLEGETPGDTIENARFENPNRRKPPEGSVN